MQLFIPLLDFFVEGLVFDLELLEIDQMQAVCKLLLLFQDLLLVGKAVSQGDILEAELGHLLVFLELSLLLHLDVLLRDLLAGPGVDCVLSDASLKLLELALDLLALCLLLVELSLELTRHLVVPVLSLLEVEAHLMHIG